MLDSGGFKDSSLNELLDLGPKVEFPEDLHEMMGKSCIASHIDWAERNGEEEAAAELAKFRDMDTDTFFASVVEEKRE